MTHWFLDRIASHGERPAFLGDGIAVSHADMAHMAEDWARRLSAAGVEAGEVVDVLGDHSPGAFAALLALAARRAIVAPLTSAPEAVLRDRFDTAGARWSVNCADGEITRLDHAAPPMVEAFRVRGRAGLILFSSGSSGPPKACLLDLDRLLETAKTQRPGWVTLAFLLFDHIGGINTVINVLGHGGAAVAPADRSAEAVAAAIEAHRVELLPTSPTFLKMLLISDAAARHDLSSLKLITYGTEVMPPTTLGALAKTFPNARLKQTYGLSEIGIVPTRSRSPGSLWMKIGGDDVAWKVVDGVLWLKAPTAMVGYLNADDPFDEDGWLNTRDKVEVDGEYLKILGRDTEMINVGGEKVHPTEVEDVLLSAGNISDATVSARANPVTGAVVVASVALVNDEEPRALKARLGAYCRARLEPHKVPVRFTVTTERLHSDRFKKLRAG